MSKSMSPELAEWACGVENCTRCQPQWQAMPSRRRPKSPPVAPLTDVERFAQAVRESEAAERRAKQAERDRKMDAERRALEAAERAVTLARARAAHQHAVEQVKEAKRTGKGLAAADEAWKQAKAALIELETGQPPPWARTQEAEPPADSAESADESSPES